MNGSKFLTTQIINTMNLSLAIEKVLNEAESSALGENTHEHQSVLSAIDKVQDFFDKCAHFYEDEEIMSE